MQPVTVYEMINCSRDKQCLRWVIKQSFHNMHAARWNKRKFLEHNSRLSCDNQTLTWTVHFVKHRETEAQFPQKLNTKYLRARTWNCTEIRSCVPPPAEIYRTWINWKYTLAWIHCQRVRTSCANQYTRRRIHRNDGKNRFIFQKKLSTLAQRTHTRITHTYKGTTAIQSQFSCVRWGTVTSNCFAMSAWANGIPETQAKNKSKMKLELFSRKKSLPQFRIEELALAIGRVDDHDCTDNGNANSENYNLNSFDW